MGEEKSSQCDPRLVHCSLDGRFDCECGAERQPKLTSCSRRALDTPETRSDRDLRLILRRDEPVARAIAPGFLPEVRFRLRR
jgi:hypothetical protein